MDHFRLTTRLQAISRVLTLVGVAVGGVWIHHAFRHDAHPPYPIHYGAFLAFLGVTVGMAIASAMADLNPWMLQRVKDMSAPLLVAMIAVMASGDAGLVATMGGFHGPFWVIFIPLVACSAMNQRRTVAVAIVVVINAALATGALTANDFRITPFLVVHSLLICPFLLVLGGAGAMISELVMTGTTVAETERDLVTDHVRGVSDALDDAARGDLAVPVPHPRDAQAQPSLETLSVSMEHMLADLRGLVGHVRGGGEQVGTSAAQLLATAEQHAASATQQSTAVTETTTTIEELAATAAQIAETAEAVARYAAETLSFAQEGQDAVRLSVEAMDTIGGSVDSMARRALTLGERTHEIGRIVEVIDDLADQTNLLALNAAIEAARAGDHGRGFAVVATEIRKLAERAQTSTSQIRAIVGEVQAETHATIVASEEGAREARVGVELARGVAHALERIGGMVDETTTAAKEISIATQQQRSASEQVVAAMTQVSDVARQYAVGSQQTAASAAQLHSLSAQLRAAISRFTVDGAASTALPVPVPRVEPEPVPAI